MTRIWQSLAIFTSLRFVGATCLALLITAGCADHSEIPTQPRPGVAADIAAGTQPPGSGYVMTPAGWYHASCIHEIPDRSVVHGDTVSPPNLATIILPKCAYPHYSSYPVQASSALAPPPTVERGLR